MDQKNQQLTRSVTKIHQIMIVKGGKLPEVIPPAFAINADDLKARHPDAEYYMWNSEEIKELISNNFPQEVLDTYNILTPYAYKCDLGRLCLLYVQGGLYVDLGVRLMREFRLLPEIEFAVFRDLTQGPYWFMMQNGLIFSTPKRPELLYAINWIVDNCRKRYYGESSLFPTGPIQLGRAVARECIEASPGGSPSQWIGECRAVTPAHENKNLNYIDPYGNLVAVRAKVHAGDLSHMGLKEGNNHNSLWQARQIWGEKTSFWQANDTQIRLPHKGISSRLPKGITLLQPDAQGLMTFGPYLQLETGHYNFTLHLHDDTSYSALELEICAEGGAIVFSREIFSNQNRENKKPSVIFQITKPTRSIEFRLFNKGFFKGFLLGYELEALPYTHHQWKAGIGQGLRTVVGHQTENGIEVTKDAVGHALFGPYIALPKGTYEAWIHFAPGVYFKQLGSDICIQGGAKVLHKNKFHFKDLESDYTLRTEFYLPEACQDLELRLHTKGDLVGKITKIDFTRVSD